MEQFQKVIKLAEAVGAELIPDKHATPAQMEAFQQGVVLAYMMIQGGITESPSDIIPTSLMSVTMYRALKQRKAEGRIPQGMFSDEGSEELRRITGVLMKSINPPLSVERECVMLCMKMIDTEIERFENATSSYTLSGLLGETGQLKGMWD